MLCDKCKKNNATIHIKRSINGNVEEYNLCQSCASESNVLNTGSFEGFFDSMGHGIFGGLLNGIGHALTMGTGVSASEMCSSCGATFDDFLNDGNLGCPDCYESFHNRLREVIKNVQGSTRHTGKGSAEARQLKAPKELTEEERLKNQLDAAIKNEEYEEAARLRDEIRALKKKSEEG